MKGVGTNNKGKGTTCFANEIDFICILITHYEKSCLLQLVLCN